MYCSKCGRENPDNAQFCAFCATPLVQQAEQETPQNQFYQQPIVVQAPKKSKLPTAAIILAPMPLLLVLGFLTLNIFFVVLGIISILPAAIVSLIALIVTIIKKKKSKDHPKSELIKSIVAVSLSIILPISALVTLRLTNNIRKYNSAIEAYEEQDYETAYNSFVELENYKNSQEWAIESRYQLGISLANRNEWSRARYIFKELSQQGYNSSKALYLYSLVYEEASSKISSAEYSITRNLKDPSSYQNLGNRFSYLITDRSDSTLDLKLTVTVNYSATNSFGGRVSDTYTAEYNVVLTNMEGVNAALLHEIMATGSIQGVANKYAYLK